MVPFIFWLSCWNNSAHFECNGTSTNACACEYRSSLYQAVLYSCTGPIILHGTQDDPDRNSPGSHILLFCSAHVPHKSASINFSEPNLIFETQSDARAHIYMIWHFIKIIVESVLRFTLVCVSMSKKSINKSKINSRCKLFGAYAFFCVVSATGYYRLTSTLEWQWKVVFVGKHLDGERKWVFVGFPWEQVGGRHPDTQWCQFWREDVQ